MKQYTLSSESEASGFIETMSDIIQTHGYITVGELHVLLGLPHTFVDDRNGWKNTNNILHPGAYGTSEVTLEFPDPVAIVPEVKPPQGVLRVTMEFDSSENVDTAIMNLLKEADILNSATAWSITRRPRSGPRVPYTYPIVRRDDI